MKYYNEGKTLINCFLRNDKHKNCFYESYSKIHALYSIMKTIQEITEKSDSDYDIPCIDTDSVYVRKEKDE